MALRLAEEKKVSYKQTWSLVLLVGVRRTNSIIAGQSTKLFDLDQITHAASIHLRCL